MPQTMVKLTITFTPTLNEEAFVVVRFIARRVKKCQRIFLIHPK